MYTHPSQASARNGSVTRRAPLLGDRYSPHMFRVVDVFVSTQPSMMRRHGRDQ
ncbi:hypothetical protein I545_2312 [Mycobacterium kansasii 662]|uniref:Uncharacterized protein n=2 Tax=Mycobacterium kansasii TaxID=1768 RepID=A0A1V3XHP5_MYCKA|nr:hypothetical protein I547_4185 [Mycobacterium kansasii 824]EUA19672.1 hypothetical protein I545_2312 [Mycobacterium kansasii 662]KEP40254.1 hypothetical protein MKSMC1_45980 [Mycobacterium kansasii]OOK78735.1 hypothetical protein BZL30_1860 [Mycobacterium kansasii]OOK80827.1 hypothetical protein BZL29_1911 [Mycobacterium kansasii]